jgi:hypothetical protein
VSDSFAPVAGSRTIAATAGYYSERADGDESPPGIRPIGKAREDAKRR